MAANKQFPSLGIRMREQSSPGTAMYLLGLQFGMPNACLALCDNFTDSWGGLLLHAIASCSNNGHPLLCGPPPQKLQKLTFKSCLGALAPGGSGLCNTTACSAATDNSRTPFSINLHLPSRQSGQGFKVAFTRGSNALITCGGILPLLCTACFCHNHNKTFRKAV